MANPPPTQPHRTLAEFIDALSGQKTKPALVAMGEREPLHWDYATLADYGSRMAQGLLNRGVSKGENIGLFAENSPAWIACCLGVIRAGAVVTPWDVQSSEDVLEHLVTDSSVRRVFTSSTRVERLRRVAPDVEVIMLDGEGEDTWQHWLANTSVALPDAAPDDPATLFYTSGTTGPPKGVPLTHRNLAFQLDTLIEARLVQPDDRVLLPLPLHHVYPFVLGMFGPLSLGVPLILPRSLTGPDVVRALRDGQATLVVGVPRLYDALYSGVHARLASQGRLAARLGSGAMRFTTWLRKTAHLRSGKILLAPLHRQIGPSLRLVASGGAALNPELAWRLEGIGWQVATGYGLTETAPLLTLNLPGDAKLETAGRPIRGVELRIDPSAVQAGPAQGGKPQGEILARGPNVFAGYRKLPDRNREAFTEDGWFRTGDMGWLGDDGFLRITGRVSTLIVTPGGENVQPDVVETIYAEHPFIREIGVLQREEKMAAVVVPDMRAIREQGLDIDAAVRQGITEQSRKLPSFQRVVDFAVTREPLPVTRLGKIRRHLLPERFDQARREGLKPEAAGPMALEEMAPEDRDLLEQNPAARQVWEWLAARYPRQRLTPDTSLQFDLGVDSMEWLNLTLDVGQRTGVEISEEAVGRVETVRDLLQETAQAAERGAEHREVPWDNPQAVLSESQKRWLKPLGPIRGWITHSLYGLSTWLLRRLFHLQVQGRDRLPEGSCVLAPNHVSSMDPFAVAAALDRGRQREVYWGGWTGVVFTNPLMRLFSRMARIFPVDPRAGVLSSLAFGGAVLRRGKILVWFPEGQRSPDGGLQDFKPGIGVLLEHYDVPVIPVYVYGSREALPPGNRIPKRHPIRVVFGEPFDPRHLSEQGSGDNPATRITNALHDHMAEAI